jgi:hypothetical protein
MTIFYEKGKYELKHYKKPQTSKVLTNFYSETPKNYKISSLMGSIYRINDTTSNENELKNGLKELKNNFVNNGFPVSLINEKINQIKTQNFKPKIKKLTGKKK